MTKKIQIYALFFILSSSVFATPPSKLICLSYGYTVFEPGNNPGKRLETSNEKENWSKDDSTTNINLSTGILTYYTFDGKVESATISKINEVIYLADYGSGTIETLFFDKDYKKLVLSSDGYLSEFFVCKRN